MSALKLFLERMATKHEPRVLELGTRRTDPHISTIRRDWVPHAQQYIGVDFQPGMDVDVVADVHTLSNVFGENRFDGVLSLSAFEHIQYPWIASIEISRALKPGGLVYIQTVQSFPLHSFPYDFWRFSINGLKTLFGKQAGYKNIYANYEYPCKIISADKPNSEKMEAYLVVTLLAEKQVHPTQAFMYNAAANNDPENKKLYSDAIICTNPEAVLESMKLDRKYLEESRYNGLNNSRIFGPIIRFGDKLINNPLELQILPDKRVKIARYNRLKKHWFFGPFVRLGDRILKPPAEMHGSGG